MKQLRIALLACLLPVMVSCRSRVVRVNLVNTSSQPITVITVDYPGASFGVNKLDPGKTYLYPIKPVETGPLKIQFTDFGGNSHSFTGPVLHKNDEGSLEVNFDQQGATARLTPSAK
jgi:hypothetical protein